MILAVNIAGEGRSCQVTGFLLFNADVLYRPAFEQCKFFLREAGACQDIIYQRQEFSQVLG